MSKQDWNQSQYYQEDFLASHSARPGSDEARKMTATSGLRCLELYKKSDPVGLLVRMLLESSHWRSTRFYLTRKDLNGPYSPDNCQWREVPVNRATIENHKTMAKQWDEFITPIRERYAGELERIEKSKREFFQYEHPDLVREGIVFECSIHS